jgi:hypothetical protein
MPLSLAAQLLLTGSVRKRDGMSQRNVGEVIDKLLTDQDLRTQFALDRFVTIAHLHLLGLSLTPAEIDVFVQSDLRCWLWKTLRLPGHVH